MKKPVKKKAIGGALGALASGDMRGAITGVLPMMLMDRDKKRKERDKRARDTVVGSPTQMKRGGKIDGAAKRGKTKGRKC